MANLFYNNDKWIAALSRSSDSSGASLLNKGFPLKEILEVPDEVDLRNFLNSHCLDGNGTDPNEYYGVVALKLAPHMKWAPGRLKHSVIKRRLMTSGHRGKDVLIRVASIKEAADSWHGSTTNWFIKVDKKNPGLVNALQELQMMTLGRALHSYGAGITADRQHAVGLRGQTGGKGVWLIGTGLILEDDLPDKVRAEYELPWGTHGQRGVYAPDVSAFKYLNQHFVNSTRSHSFNPLTLFNAFYLEDGKAVTSKEGVDMHVPFMGVELETVPIYEQYSSSMRHAQNLEILNRGRKFFVAKSDGSLRNNGMELVTCPAVYEQQMEKWKEFEGQQAVAAQGANCAGLHIHINRTSLAAMTLGKIVKLMDGSRDGESSEGDIMYSLGGRLPNQYCQSIRSDGSALTNREKITKNEYRERYSVVNFNNSNTIEFRFMKGTCAPADLRSKIQLVQAMIDFSQTHSASAMKVDKFLSWIGDKPRTEKFPELAELVTALTDENPSNIGKFVE